MKLFAACLSVYFFVGVSLAHGRSAWLLNPDDYTCMDVEIWFQIPQNRIADAPYQPCSNEPKSQLEPSPEIYISKRARIMPHPNNKQLPFALFLLLGGCIASLAISLSYAQKVERVNKKRKSLDKSSRPARDMTHSYEKQEALDSAPPRSPLPPIPSLQQGAIAQSDRQPHQTDWVAFTQDYKPALESQAYPPYRCTQLEENVANLLNFAHAIESHRDYYFRMDVMHEIAYRFQAWAKLQKVRAGLLIQAQADTRYWFIGDTHGHFEAVVKAFTFIDAEARKCPNQKQCIIILGDAIDRGAHCLESLCYIMDRMMSEDPRYHYIYIKGNHDEGLSIQVDQSFKSSVSPAETVERLNAARESNAFDASLMAQCIIELVRISPSMGEIVGLDEKHPHHSILFMHAGVPHTDLQEQLFASVPAAQSVSPLDFLSLIPDDISQQTGASLRRRCEEDFTWGRLVVNLPFKKPQRMVRGCEIGTYDVGQYLRLHRRLTGRTISFMIRGHDHEIAGYTLYSYDKIYNDSPKKMVQKDCGVLTINTMEPEEFSSSGLFKSRQIALASWEMGCDLTCFVIPTQAILKD